MDNFQILFFAWCHQETHDKIWGYMTIDGDKNIYNFYGKRGKDFVFKRNRTLIELKKIARTKTSKYHKTGVYTEVETKNIENIVPGFFNEFKKQLGMAKLFDKFHGENI